MQYANFVNLIIYMPFISAVNGGSRNCNEGGQPDIEQCCTEDRPCDEGQGDCDHYRDCKGLLVCGVNNCDQSKFNWTDADCCESGKEILFLTVINVARIFIDIQISFQ